MRSNRLAPAVVLVLAAIPAAVAYIAVLGLGWHRHAGPWSIAVTATALVFGPPLVTTALTRFDRVWVMAGSLGAWAAVLLVGLPIYFPGERRDAVATGIGLMGLGRLDHVARTVADNLPDDPELAKPRAPQAEGMAARATLAPPEPLRPHQIALPYEGEGRRITVPVVFTHENKSLEVYMMLDTGATYTTLPESVFAELGITIDETIPSIRLHTANGERDARLVLLDEVWLGDLPVSGVAVAMCDHCASSDTVGLLGLNVADGFNVSIDADRREVIFAARNEYDRKLDIKPFVDLAATFRRHPGGHVEVEVEMNNRARQPVRTAVTSVHCGEASWVVELTDVPPHANAVVRRRLPEHEPCDNYEFGLHRGAW